MRSGYCRAAAGVMGCMLLGGALGIGTQYTASLSAAAVSMSVFPTNDTVEQPVVQLSDSQSPAYMTLDRRLAYKLASSRAHSYRTATYTVDAGDTLSEVARESNTDIEAILSLNPDLDPDYIRPGDVIQLVPNLHGLVRQVQPGDTLELIARLYDVSIGDILTANNLTTDSILPAGASLFLPGARAVNHPVASRGDHVRRSTALAGGPEGWHWPLSGGIYSTEFGAHHAGLDIAVPSGTTVIAAHSGTVSFAGWDGGYGYCVIVDHGDGITTRYAHASVLLVRAGQAVEAMEPVIKVGSTGNSTGPHLHFEVLVNGVPNNPRYYLP